MAQEKGSPMDQPDYLGERDLSDYGLSLDYLRRFYPQLTELTGADGRPCWSLKDLEDHGVFSKDIKQERCL
jgi:hypothetical protein